MERFGKVCKEYMVKEIAEHFKNYPDFFLTTFSRISVGEMEKLKREFKRETAVYIVVKNTMLKQAMRKLDERRLGDVMPLISGFCGVLFSKGEPTSVARRLVNFHKYHENFIIQGGFINGEKILSDTVKLLASLPSREVLLAMVTSSMRAPISNFVGLLNNLMRSLTGVLDAISKKKS